MSKSDAGKGMTEEVFLAKVEELKRDYIEIEPGFWIKDV